MGGLGSGGWNHSGRTTVEGSAKLAISALRKAGGLRPGAYTVWRWSRGGEEFASIGVHGGANAIRLSYSASGETSPDRRVDERVSVERRACPFGGERAVFRCPRCGRTVLNLHLRRTRFACRNCARLTYSSRRERGRDRQLRAANKLRDRLGGEPGALNPVAKRPKGMWRRTYARIVAEIQRRECIAIEEIAGLFSQLGAGSRRPASRFW